MTLPPVWPPTVALAFMRYLQARHRGKAPEAAGTWKPAALRPALPTALLEELLARILLINNNW